MNNPSKKPWPTKEAMIQVYKENLWGGEAGAFYSGLGSHHPEVIEPYLAAVTQFLQSLETPPVVCDLGCGDFHVGKELVPYTWAYNAIDIVPALIAHNKKTYKRDNLTFYTLDIAKEELPAGDCAILRQVLQHLSNAEIEAVVNKLYQFTYVILTEHLPDGPFDLNINIISGQGTRLQKNSGVDLLAAPFQFTVKEEKELLAIPSPDGKRRIVTWLYRVC